MKRMYAVIKTKVKLVMIRAYSNPIIREKCGVQDGLDDRSEYNE